MPDRPPLPLVGVVVPTYNRADVLPRALQSALRQTYEALEVIVVDDGSTDDTEAVVAALDDPRVRYVLQPRNAGVSAARNRGIREARGEFIAFLDSDDEWFPDKIERQVARFREVNNRVGLLYCGVRSVSDRRGDWTFRPKHRGDVYEAMLQRNVIHTGSGVVIRREVVDVVGGFDEEIPAIEDYEYWLRIARHFEFDFVEEPLFRYFDETDLDRKSLDTQDNHDARAYLFNKHRAEMRRVGVAPLFLTESARRHLRGPRPAGAIARRLLLQALWERPTYHPALLLLISSSAQAGRQWASQLSWMPRRTSSDGEVQL